MIQGARQMILPWVTGSFAGNYASLKGGGRWKEDGRIGESDARPTYILAIGGKRLRGDITPTDKIGRMASHAAESPE
jgi:hypothetical protein